MLFSAWGGYPKSDCDFISVDNKSNLSELLNYNKSYIPYGNGRSYGDSALGDNIIGCRKKNYFISFDKNDGLLHVQAGVLLSEIIEHFVPRGWFPKVVPGTKLITIGGAIASDVHGKNHHKEGCFSETVKELTIMLADGSVVSCDRECTPELFKATCGGQGLTGVILDAKIYLKKIYSQYLNQEITKTKNLEETLYTFERYNETQYSVAWIDCLSKNKGIGKGLFMAGDFCHDGDLNLVNRKTYSVPFKVPPVLINKWFVKAFNWIYYNKVKSGLVRSKVHLDSFFFPLDSIKNWNRLYGDKGFIQYQFIIPKSQGLSGLKEILSVISEKSKGSPLAVLKMHGKDNGNWLSFPFEGYSFAIDFKIEKDLFSFLRDLDELVLKYHGRFYLAKDARVSKSVFEVGYPNIEKFRHFRKVNKMDKKFQSIQSKRIGI